MINSDYTSQAFPMQIPAATAERIVASVNAGIVGKPNGNAPALFASTTFELMTITPDELIDFATAPGKGYATGPAWDGPRGIGSFVAAYHIAVDLDDPNAARLAELDPLVIDHAAALFDTPSSTPDAPRRRVIFVLDEPIISAREFTRLAAWLADSLGGDPKATDAARCMFGNPGAAMLLRHPDRRLSLATLRRWAGDAPQTHQDGHHEAITVIGTPRTSDPASDHLIAQIESQLGVTHFGVTGWADGLICPFHDDGDRSRSASWSRQGGGMLKCHVCQPGPGYVSHGKSTYGVIDTARALGIAVESATDGLGGVLEYLLQPHDGQKIPAGATIARGLIALYQTRAPGDALTAPDVLAAVTGAGVTFNKNGAYALTSWLRHVMSFASSAHHGSNGDGNTADGNGMNFSQNLQGNCSGFTSQVSLQKSGKIAGPGRKSQAVVLPSPRDLSAALDVPCHPTPELAPADLRTAKTFRLAMHRDLIARAPGERTRKVLGDRLGVKERTISTYDRELKNAGEIITEPTFVPADPDDGAYAWQDSAGRLYPLTPEGYRAAIERDNGQTPTPVRRGPNYRRVTTPDERIHAILNKPRRPTRARWERRRHDRG